MPSASERTSTISRGLVRFSSGGAILCFHSLTTPQLTSESLVNVPLARFVSMVRAIKRVAHIVPLAELIETHQNGRPTGGAVALSFDDAYASLLLIEDIVRAERMPITVFVTTDSAENGAHFWWDRVEDLFSRVTPERWRIFEHEIGLPLDYKRGQPAEFGPLRPFRQWILADHQGRCPDHIERALARLEAEHGFRTLHRSMTFSELAAISRVPLVDFGVHTRTHPVLPLLDRTEFESEVGGAFQLLQARLPRVSPILAIPFGLFDHNTAAWARGSGMIASLTLAGRTLRGYAGDEGFPRFCLTRREPTWKLLLRTTGVAERILSTRMEGGPGYPPLPSATT